MKKELLALIKELRATAHEGSRSQQELTAAVVTLAACMLELVEDKEHGAAATTYAINKK